MRRALVASLALHAALGAALLSVRAGEPRPREATTAIALEVIAPPPVTPPRDVLGGGSSRTTAGTPARTEVRGRPKQRMVRAEPSELADYTIDRAPHEVDDCGGARSRGQRGRAGGDDRSRGNDGGGSGRDDRGGRRDGDGGGGHRDRGGSGGHDGDGDGGVADNDGGDDGSSSGRNDRGGTSARPDFDRRGCDAGVDRDGDGGEGDGAGGHRGAGIGFGDGGRIALAEQAFVLPAAPAGELPKRSQARPAKLIYPTRQRDLGADRLFVARVTVDTDGYVVGARLVRGVTGPRDDEAADLIFRFRYLPALDDDGRAIRSTFDQPFHVNR